MTMVAGQLEAAEASGIDLLCNGGLTYWIGSLGFKVELLAVDAPPMKP